MLAWPLLLILLAADWRPLPVSPEPPSAEVLDLSRFPDAEACIDALAFNWTWQASLDQRWVMQPQRRAELFLLIGDARRRAEIWRSLQGARGGDPGEEEPPADDGLALDRLRLLLGEEDFWAGRMPDAVPWRLFPVGD